MPKQKYKYRHFYCNREMSKNAFLDKLQHRCTKIDRYGDGSNPLLNIESVDLKLLNRTYNQTKRTGQIYIYPGEWFQIKKEPLCVELTKWQILRLHDLMKLKDSIDKATYKSEGLFSVEGYETYFDVTLSKKDTDWVLHGVHLTREAA